MKTKLFTLLFAIMASIGTIFANGTEIDGICYILNSSDMTAAVTYRGSNATNSYANISTITIPASVNYMGLAYDVTSIGNSAFAECSGLTSVTIGNSVTSIGQRAFQNCSGLTSIEIPNSVTSIGQEAFRSCSAITSIELPNSVTSIGAGAFFLCTGLTSITIPKNVTNIDGMVFERCDNLTNIVWNVKTYDDFTPSLSPFYSSSGYQEQLLRSQITSFIIGDDVENIPAYLCYGMQNISNTITIPNRVTRIGSYAFYGCSNLPSIILGEGVTYIGESAFSQCSSLANVTIDNSITSIGTNAFSGCSFASLNLPDGITSIGSYAFSACSALSTINIPYSITSIGNGAFSGCSNLNLVYCELGTPLSIGSTTFQNASPTIYISNCAFAAFSVAPVWKDMAIAPVSVNLAVMNNTGGVVVENCGQMEIEAIPYIGYQFRRWQDGNKDNPRKEGTEKPS